MLGCWKVWTLTLYSECLIFKHDHAGSGRLLLVFSAFCCQYYWYYWLLNRSGKWKWVLPFFHKGCKKQCNWSKASHLSLVPVEGGMHSRRNLLLSWSPLVANGELGKLQLRLSHFRVDGLFDWMNFSSELHRFAERFNSVTNFAMGAKGHFSCAGIPLLAKDSVFHPQSVSKGI